MKMEKYYPTGVGYVYVIESGDQVKIGCSRHPERRIQALQSQSGRALTRQHISHLHDGYLQTEQDLHRHFAKARLLGEWFSESFDTVVARLCELVYEPISEDRLEDIRAEQLARNKAGADALIRWAGGDPDWEKKKSDASKRPIPDSSVYESLFDVTGIAPNCSSLIYRAGERLMDIILTPGALDAGLSEQQQTDIEELSRELAKNCITIRERREEINRMHPHLAADESSLVAIQSLTDFAERLMDITVDECDRVVDLLHDLAFDMVQHDHARAWFHFVLDRLVETGIRKA